MALTAAQKATLVVARAKFAVKATCGHLTVPAPNSLAGVCASCFKDEMSAIDDQLLASADLLSV